MVGNSEAVVPGHFPAPKAPRSGPHPKALATRYRFQRVARRSAMKTIAFAALGLTALALSACAGRYYDGYYDRYGTNYGDRYYGDRYYDRDRDNDGVPNYADRRPYNPYRY